MTVPSESYRVAYAGDGVSTTFAIPFRFSSNEDVRVAIRDSDGSAADLTSGFTITGADTDDGECVMASPPAVGQTLVLGHSPVATQELDYVSNDAFPAESHEAGLDRSVRLVHRTLDRGDRSLRVPFGDAASADDMRLPAAGTRANKYLRFDSNGKPELVDFDDNGSALSRAIIAEHLNPRTAAEISLGYIPDAYWFTEEYLQVKRHGAIANGSQGNAAADTLALQKALAIATYYGGGKIVFTRGNYVIDTPIVPDCNGLEFIGDGATITKGTGIPVNGAAFQSLAGDAHSATDNQAILDAIYGAGVVLVRQNVTGSLERVVFRGLKFVDNAAGGRCLHFTGFTRNCIIDEFTASNFALEAIALNGSWDFLLRRLLITGTTGTGVALGIVGNGKRSNGSTGTEVCNAVEIAGGNIRGVANGVIWNYGAGGRIKLTVEQCGVDGIRSQSASGVVLDGGTYLEQNAGDNLQLGGTNGTDFCIGWVVEGIHLNQTVAAGGNNIRLQGVKRCRFGKLNFSGDKTQWYFIASNVGQYVQDCDIEVPNVTSTYVSNAATELRADLSTWHDGCGRKFRNTATGAQTFNQAAPAQFHIKPSGSNATWTVDAQATVPMRRGTIIEGANLSSNTLTLAVTTDTLLFGSGTGNRAVAQGGRFRLELLLSTADGDASNTWLLTGTGIT